MNSLSKTRGEWYSKRYFFCGIGGSGMMPLSLILKQKGAVVAGSDRSYDQGAMPEKFQTLIEQGIILHPQDGSGVGAEFDYLVVSSAVEPRIPDVVSAKACGIPIITRGELLSKIFNEAPCSIAVAGTSGKSTVTAMIGVILQELGLDPTVVNGGAVNDFVEKESDFHVGLASIRAGASEYFISEMDESDGSINYYTPEISILNNISLDHKTMEELEQLFGDYIARTKRAIVANFDNKRARVLVSQIATINVISYSLQDDRATLFVDNIIAKREGIAFVLHYEGMEYPVQLKLLGLHNIQNALSALGACTSIGIPLVDAITALEKFGGVHRRMEYIGARDGVIFYDDFGHNPDKIAASLESLKAFSGRLIVMFQPHGFGPLRLMGNEIVGAFSSYLDPDDILIMPEVYYAGGTVDRSVCAADIIDMAKAKGVRAYWFESRGEIPDFIEEHMRSGDRVVIMGARDDTLHDFTKGLCYQ